MADTETILPKERILIVKEVWFSSRAFTFTDISKTYCLCTCLSRDVAWSKDQGKEDVFIVEMARFFFSIASMLLLVFIAISPPFCFVSGH